MADKKNDAKFFCVRDLPEDTRKKIKIYAVQHDQTMAQAVESLVNVALESEQRHPPSTPEAAAEAQITNLDELRRAMTFVYQKDPGTLMAMMYDVRRDTEPAVGPSGLQARRRESDRVQEEFRRRLTSAPSDPEEN